MKYNNAPLAQQCGFLRKTQTKISDISKLNYNDLYYVYDYNTYRSHSTFSPQ